MKYLKKFESTNNYYSIISHNEYQELMGVKGVNIGHNRNSLTDKEVLSIKNILSKVPYHTYRYDIEFNTKLLGGTRHLTIKIDDDIWMIDKVKDEWFLAAHHPNNKEEPFKSEIYKCDQFEGFIKLIKDKIIK